MDWTPLRGVGQLLAEAEDQNVDVGERGDHPVDDVAPPQALPQGAMGRAHHHERGPLLSGDGDDLAGHLPSCSLPADHHGAEVTGHRQRVPHLLGRIAAGVHGDDQELAALGVGQPEGAPDHRGAGGGLVDAGEHPLGGAPRRLDPMDRQVLVELPVHRLRGPGQGELAQRVQVPRPKEVLQRTSGGGVGVDLALLQAMAQLVGGQVDQDDLVGTVEDLVGDALPHLDPGDRLDHVVEALQVLDVEGGEHIDPLGQDGVDVLVAPGPGTAGGVGVGQLVDGADLGAAGDHGVGVELLDGDPAVLDPTPGDHDEPVEQGGGVGPPVGLDEADDGVTVLADQVVHRPQHGVGLAHAGGETEEDGEAPGVGCDLGPRRQHRPGHTLIPIGVRRGQRRLLVSRRWSDYRGRGSPRGR